MVIVIERLDSGVIVDWRRGMVGYGIEMFSILKSNVQQLALRYIINTAMSTPFLLFLATRG